MKKLSPRKALIFFPEGIPYQSRENSVFSCEITILCYRKVGSLDDVPPPIERDRDKEVIVSSARAVERGVSNPQKWNSILAWEIDFPLESPYFTLCIRIHN